MLKSHTRVILFILLLITLSVTPAAQGTPAPLSINVGTGSTDIILQNTGIADANVVVEYLDQSGNLRAYPAGIIKPKGAMELKGSEIGDLGGSWIGSATASSDQQLGVVALTQWTGGSSKDGKVAGAYSGFPTGSQSTFIPYLLYRPSVTEPLITVQNTGTQEAVISMIYINTRGETDFTGGNISILVGGQKTFDLSVPGEEVPDLRNSDFFKEKGQWNGGVRIEARTGQSIAAIVTSHCPQWSFMDSAVSQGDTKLFAPNVARRIVNGKVRQITYLSVQNMTNGDVTIKIELRDRTMPSVGKTIRRKLGPYGVAFFNTRWMTALDRYPDDPDQDIWEGSATITATGGNIAATVVMLRQEIRAAGQYLAMGPSSGGTQIFFPLAYRIYSGSKPVQHSLLRLQNTTDTDATNVDIFFYDRTGKEIYKRLNRSIPARQSLGLDFKTLSALGPNFTGTVYVTSDQNLVGVMDILWSNLQLVSYNAISK